LREARQYYGGRRPRGNLGGDVVFLKPGTTRSGSVHYQDWETWIRKQGGVENAKLIRVAISGALGSAVFFGRSEDPVRTLILVLLTVVLLATPVTRWERRLFGERPEDDAGRLESGESDLFPRS